MSVSFLTNYFLQTYANGLLSIFQYYIRPGRVGSQFNVPAHMLFWEIPIFHYITLPSCSTPKMMALFVSVCVSTANETLLECSFHPRTLDNFSSNMQQPFWTPAAKNKGALRNHSLVINSYVIMINEKLSACRLHAIFIAAVNQLCLA